MKPYNDIDCACYRITDEINKKFPNSDWNLDAACEEWKKRKSELTYNSIKFECDSEGRYSCTCPTCGRIVCRWCL